MTIDANLIEGFKVGFVCGLFLMGLVACALLKYVYTRGFDDAEKTWEQLHKDAMANVRNQED